MTVSVEEIDRWNGGDVREVFYATRSRAEAAFEAANGIAELPAFGSWGGDASEAAIAAIGQTRKDLDAHGNEALAVAQAASKAADDVEQVKSDLAALRSDAEHMGMAIDPIGNTVEPGPGSAGADPMEIMIKQMQLQERLDKLLSDAARVDAELAKAIDMAIGNEPIPNTGPPVGVPSAPPRSTNPKDVRKWWDSLTPTQREDVARYQPAEIGNLEGVPSAVRQQVNAARLPGEITKAQATLDALNAHHVGHPNPSQLDAREAANNKLADLRQLQTTLKDHPGTGLLLLDVTTNQKNVLAAVAYGDVDNAKQVGVTVGGMTTNVRGGVDGMTGEVIEQQKQAVTLGLIAGTPDPHSVATIAWLGYEAPGLNFDVTDDTMAKAGAGPLNHFYQGLGATSNVPDQELTAFGHSYGSLTTSLALQEGGAPVDNVVLYGSPGGELTNASQLGVAPGHAYYIDGITDGVPTTVAGAGAFGSPLSEVPGFTALSANSGDGFPAPDGDGLRHERAYGHSEYARLGSNGELRMSGYNMAAILAGLPGDTITPATESAATHPADRTPRHPGPQPGLSPMTRLVRLMAKMSVLIALTGLLSGCVKDTTFNPYAKPENSELNKLQTTINDRPDLEPATAQMTALDAQVRSVITRISPRTMIGPSSPTPDRGCVDPYVHNIGDEYTIEQIAARPTPTTEEFQQIADALTPILTAVNFTSKTPSGSASASSTLAWSSPDGASISLINSAGTVLLYEYSTGCRLPAAWRTSPPPPDRRPIDDPNAHFPYMH